MILVLPRKCETHLICLPSHEWLAGLGERQQHWPWQSAFGDYYYYCVLPHEVDHYGLVTSALCHSRRGLVHYCLGRRETLKSRSDPDLYSEF